MNRSARLALLASTLGVTLALGWTLWTAVGPRVSTVTPVRQPLTETLLLNGRTVWPGRTELGALVQGTVAEVAVEEGAEVVAGALLVRLHDEEANARVGEAEAGLAAARAQLAKLRTVGHPAAQSALERAKIEEAQTQRDLTRDEAVFRDGFLSEAAYEATRDRHDKAVSLLVSAEIELAASSAGGAETAATAAELARAQATLSSAQAALAHTRVRAPSAGKVLARDVEPGQTVRPGDTLIVFSGDAPMQLEVTPDEVHLGKLAVGQAAKVRAEAFPDTILSAHVAEFAPAVDPGRGTIRVRLSLDEPPPAWLRADMTATVEIVLSERADALLLPLAYVQDLGGADPWVLVLDEGHAVRRPVRVGAQDQVAVEILEGLDEHDQVLRGDRATPGKHLRAGATQPALPPSDP